MAKVHLEKFTEENGKNIAFNFIENLVFYILIS